MKELKQPLKDLMIISRMLTLALRKSQRELHKILYHGVMRVTLLLRSMEKKGRKQIARSRRLPQELLRKIRQMRSMVPSFLQQIQKLLM